MLFPWSVLFNEKLVINRSKSDTIFLEKICTKIKPKKPIQYRKSVYITNYFRTVPKHDRKSDSEWETNAIFFQTSVFQSPVSEIRLKSGTKRKLQEKVVEGNRNNSKTINLCEGSVSPSEPTSTQYSDVNADNKLGHNWGGKLWWAHL